jgi:acetyltransferase
MDTRLEPYVQKCKSENRTLLTEVEAKSLLESFGIPILEGHVANSPDEAIRLANNFSKSVVLKGVTPDIPHKSDAGLVQIRLETAEEIREGYCLIQQNISKHESDAEFRGVLVEPFVEGEETIVGATLDKQFGSTVLFGLGGIFVELLEDVSLRLPPLNHADAEEMITDLQGASLLTGARGRDRKDIDAVVEVLLAMSEFCDTVEPMVSEVDINPLIVFQEGSGTVAVDALVQFADEVVEDENFDNTDNQG